MKKGKFKIKLSFGEILLLIVLAFVILVLSFGFFFSIIYHLYKFNIIGNACGLIMSIGFSIITTAALMTLIFIDFNKEKENKLLFILKKHSPKIILGIIIISIFSVSIRYDLLWTESEAKEALNVIWTIFGISITIFLVWNVIIVEYLRKKIPQKVDGNDFFQKYKYLLDKQEFLFNTQSTFSAIIMLSINLLLILFSTTSVYIMKNAGTLFTQNMLICSFYFSTNTLISLFFDMLKPIKQNKKILIEENEVTFKELNDAHNLASLQIFIRKIFELIDSDKNMSEEEKQKFREDIIEEIEKALSKDNVDDNKKNSIVQEDNVDSKEKTNAEIE